MRERIINILGLFGSTATLICCALPILLSIIAGGAAVAGLISVFPWIVPLSHHKEWIFFTAGLLLFLNGILIFKPKGEIACSVTDGKGCAIAGSFCKGVFWFSVLIYGLGAFMAYGLIHILRLFE